MLYNSFVGESERNLRQALRQIEMMSPVILWIDEIEKGFASAASQSTDGGLSKRMFGTLLTWMQDHEAPVFVIATANDIGALPPELLRKGRFDEIFFVDLPKKDTRKKIFEIHLRKRRRDPEQFNMDALAEVSKGYSGAEIEQAVLSALHVLKCLLDTVYSISKWILGQLRTIRGQVRSIALRQVDCCNHISKHHDGRGICSETDPGSFPSDYHTRDRRQGR